jgi:hypothetical protein
MLTRLHTTDHVNMVTQSMEFLVTVVRPNRSPWPYHIPSFRDLTFLGCGLKKSHRTVFLFYGKGFTASYKKTASVFKREQYCYKKYIVPRLTIKKREPNMPKPSSIFRYDFTPRTHTKKLVRLFTLSANVNFYLQ